MLPEVMPVLCLATMVNILHSVFFLFFILSIPCEYYNHVDLFIYLFFWVSGFPPKSKDGRYNHEFLLPDQLILKNFLISSPVV